MPQILLFRFTKKLNSTAVPTDSDGLPINVTIKQNVMGGREGFSKDCFVVTPTFFIQAPLAISPDRLSNEYYVKAFNRYYFIRQAMVDINGAITIFCEIDALATLREVIHNYTGYVLYGSGGSSDLEDPRIKQLNRVKTKTTEDDFGLTFSESAGYYIFTVLGDAGITDSSPFTNSYILTSSEGQTIASALLDPPFWESIAQYFTNPEAGLLQLSWAPFTKSSVSLDGVSHYSSDIVKIYGYTIESGGAAINADILTRRMFKMQHGLTIPHIYNDFRKGDNFSSYKLFIPFCGMYNIAAEELYDFDTLYINYAVDLVTGDIVGKAFVSTTEDPSNTSRTIFNFSGNCYTSIPIGKGTGYGINTVKGAIAAMAAGATLALGGVAGVGLAGALAASAPEAFGLLVTGATVGAATAGFGRQDAYSSGAISSAVGLQAGKQILLQCIAHDSIGDSVRSNYGLPMYRMARIGDLTGYCQCNGASLPCDDYSEIVYIANRQMNQGFYVE